MLLAALVLQSTGDGGDPTGGWKVWITAQADAIGSRATIAAAGAAAGLKDGLHAAADGLTDGVHVTLSTGRAAYAQHGPLLREKGTEAAEHLRATTAGLENTARKASSNVREALNDAAPIVRAAVASSVTYLKPLGASFGEGYTDLLADASSTVHEAFNDAAPIVRAAVASSVTELKALGGWVGEGYTDLLAELELIVAEQRAAAAARARGRDGHATTTKGKRCSFATHAVAEKAFRRAADVALAHGDCQHFTRASAELLAEFADELIDTELPACAKIPELLDGFNGAYTRRNVQLCVEDRHRSNTEL